MTFNYVAIISVKGSDCRIHFWYTNKHAINIVKTSSLIKKVDHYEFYYYI